MEFFEVFWCGLCGDCVESAVFCEVSMEFVKCFSWMCEFFLEFRRFDMCFYWQ